MVNKDKQKQYLAVKSMFDSNNVKKLRDIEKLYPTMIAADMGMNHGRYIQKLHNPEDFTLKQVIKMAMLINIDVNVLLKIMVSEVSARLKRAEKTK